VFSVFGEESTYFDPSPHSFMLNLRVADLTKALAALRAEGCAVDDKEERSEYRPSLFLTNFHRFHTPRKCAAIRTTLH
jgi:hypothetical protein